MQIGKIIIDCRRIVTLMGSRMSPAPTWITLWSFHMYTDSPIALPFHSIHISRVCLFPHLPHITHPDLPQGKLYSLPTALSSTPLARSQLWNISLQLETIEYLTCLTSILIPTEMSRMFTPNKVFFFFLPLSNSLGIYYTYI